MGFKDLFIEIKSGIDRFVLLGSLCWVGGVEVGA